MAGRRGSGRQQRRQDHFGKRAQREGKAARSIYKLEEIDTRWKLLRAGMRVLDLGCSPGSWMQYAGEKVGPKGQVIGYDLKDIEISLLPHMEARIGDAFEVQVEEIGGQVHVVLSDMAPATMGHHKTDALRSAALAERALDLADRLLLPGGAVVVKLLEGGEIVDLVKRLRADYSKVERLRPKATRKESTEIFLIGLGRLEKDPPSQEG
ncbi:MAG: RlmE family RNA methyltransferase [Myxococcota bacterium]|nr:RlmE family RNA methyltransferase [Myxococcota bacterium]